MPAITESKNLIVATGHLRLHATLPVSTPNLPAVYTTLDLGEAEYTLKSGGDIKEAWLAIGGVLGKSTLRRVKPTLTIERDVMHLSPAMLGYYFGNSSTGGTPSPGKVVEFYGHFELQMEDENVVGTGNSNEGSGIFVYHSFAVAFRIEGDLAADGSDFMKAKLIGEVLLGKARGTTVIGARPITPAGA